MNDDDNKQRQDYNAACGFASRLAAQFLVKLEPVDAAGALIGAAVAVLVSGLGKETATQLPA